MCAFGIFEGQPGSVYSSLNVADVVDLGKICLDQSAQHRDRIVVVYMQAVQIGISNIGKKIS